MIIIPLKAQPDYINVREIILKSSWNTHLKHSNPYTFFFKLNKPLDVFCTHLLFSSGIILIFGGILLDRLSRMLKSKLKLIRMPTTDFARQKCRTSR